MSCAYQCIDRSDGIQPPKTFTMSVLHGKYRHCPTYLPKSTPATPPDKSVLQVQRNHRHFTWSITNNHKPKITRCRYPKILSSLLPLPASSQYRPSMVHCASVANSWTAVLCNSTKILERRRISFFLSMHCACIPPTHKQPKTTQTILPHHYIMFGIYSKVWVPQNYLQPVGHLIRL